MDTFIIIAMSVGLFVSGMSLGAFIENKRLYSVKLVRDINESFKETQQLLLPLANKITHFDMRQRHFINHTLVDYNNERDPEITLEIPVYESLTSELELKEEQWQKNQRSWED
jgi:hypothetical protein|tara:strand:+ start:207 stop:545 length:339 start_codon:yes stop_codon:yes gene_type:complete